MALILNIESSTNICSVSLARSGELVSLKESRDERSHASLLTIFILELLSEHNLQPADLDAVSVSKGPGSYTGLRIGVSVAKGIVYATGIHLIGIDTLQSIAFKVSNQLIKPDHKENILLCPMIDARRMEVFTALYLPDNKLFKNITAEIIHRESFREILEEHNIWFFGNGSDKCRNIITHPNATFIEGIEPSASAMVFLSEKAFNEQRFEDVAYFEPFYLKDFVVTIPGKNVLSF